MEFSCLWSKDAQQKKRKRWTDGVAKFDPTTGVLTIWDQDESTKVSSSRLKPDEANAVLQENGDETRVGSASLQIMAQLHGTAATHQRDPLAELTVDSARKPEAALTSSRVAPGKVGGRVGAAIGGATRSARGLGTGVKRRLGATITTATANSLLQSPSSPPVRDVSSGLAAGEATAARDERTSPLPLSLPSPSSSSLLTDATPASIVDSMTTPAGDTVLQAAATSTIPQTNTPLAAGGAFAGGLYGRGRGGGLERKRNGCKPPAPSKSLGSSPRYDSADDSSNTVAAAEATATPAVVARNQTGGLRTRGGGNVGGLRRFHAPRLASGKRSSTDTPSNGGTAEGDPVPPFTSSAKAPRLSGVGGNVRRGSDVGAHNAGGGGGSSAGGTSAATTTAVVDPEDVVLEWTKGTPPQPIRAGATLARRLHPHQREGLKVLWDCLAGRGGYEGRGAILADEMGLGKTATAIALCTCVLRHRKAECRKAVIVCPSSLVKNWANEFRKWCPLGGGAVAVEQAGAAAAQLVADFKIGAAVRYPILVISYELYRNHGKVINSTEGLGLLIADEGHRLKNSSETKTTKVLKACPASMRLVLTGTPMQNDLDEFFAVADFVNPGLLGDLKTFRSRFTRPIKAAWDREADSDVSELAAERSRELGELTEKFVLRRTKDVIRGSLPPALEVVVFCRPSPQQLNMYERCIASSSKVRAFLEREEERNGREGGDDGGGGEGGSLRGVLPLISTLRRLCNHPDLVSREKYADHADEDTSPAAMDSDDEEQRQQQPVSEELDSDEEDVAFLLLDQDETTRPLDCSPPVRENNRGVAVGDGTSDPAPSESSRSSSASKQNNTPPASTAGRTPTRAFDAPRANPRKTGEASGIGGARTMVERGGTTSSSTAERELAEPRYETKASGKLAVLEGLLRAVRRECPSEKMVISSNFTSALDVLGGLADANGWNFLRLDGGTASNQRQSLVDRFNRASAEKSFLFLLSAKAGGVGLNLVGASRIVLFDSDWNPATDDQAMARVWRLGQAKEVSMYRFLTTGTLEESIYQRQIFKGALYDLIHDSNEPSSSNQSCEGDTDQEENGRYGTADKMRKDSRFTAGRTPRRRRSGNGGGGRNARGFSHEELRELFVLKTETLCDTYDKLRRGQPEQGEGGRGEEVPFRSRYPEATGSDTENESLTTARGAGAHAGRTGVIDGEAQIMCATGEKWGKYEGPGCVVDSALRCALMDGAEEGGNTAGDLVTFVHEVKRGANTTG